MPMKINGCYGPNSKNNSRGEKTIVDNKTYLDELLPSSNEFIQTNARACILHLRKPISTVKKWALYAAFPPWTRRVFNDYISEFTMVLSLRSLYPGASLRR
jgi:hypothetical protein